MQVLALSLIATLCLQAASPFEQLVTQVRTATALQCQLRSSSGEDIRIVATRGGKLRLESKQRTVVSNGAIVWNYVPGQNTVTIAPVPSSGNATFDRVVFQLLERYRVEQQSSGRVILVPTGEPVYGVRRLVLDFRSGRLRALTIEATGGSEQWQVRSLRFNPAVSAEQFEFTVPVGAEVVDMR
ncbi:MAG: hypothetical protein KatS3mg039_1296 [Candidatus Kapaibacterium sp.]|nr:MAG: hypothetical protein KatS3mg039_1296 [Candidatus Kapabacteria bacterium]